MQLFNVGRIILTFEAAKELQYTDWDAALRRHAAGDWGDIDDARRNANHLALLTRMPREIVSAFDAANGTKFVVSTDANRTYTVVDLKADSLLRAA